VGAEYKQLFLRERRCADARQCGPKCRQAAYHVGRIEQGLDGRRQLAPHACRGMDGRPHILVRNRPAQLCPRYEERLYHAAPHHNAGCRERGPRQSLQQDRLYTRGKFIHCGPRRQHHTGHLRWHRRPCERQECSPRGIRHHEGHILESRWGFARILPHGRIHGNAVLRGGYQHHAEHF
jgi:hypothetical protein